MMLQLHDDASLNTGGLTGSQGGYICGVTDKSLLEGCDAPWSPMAWRSFKMIRTLPSSLGAEAQAMSVALGLVEWATLFPQELFHGKIRPAGRFSGHAGETSRVRDGLQEPVRSSVGCLSTLRDKRSTIDVLIIRESMWKTGCMIRWAHLQDCNWQTVSRKTRERLSNVFFEACLRSGSFFAPL